MVTGITGCKKKPNTGYKSASSSSPSSSYSGEPSQAESSEDNSSFIDQSSSIPVADRFPATSSQYNNHSNSTSLSDSSDEIPNKTPIVRPGPDYVRKPITVSEIVNNNGKSYMMYLGKPYLQYGVQVVLDRTAGMSEKQNQEFFEKAAEVGFNTVIVAVNWKSIEPEENSYNLYAAKRLIDFANKYSQNIEILWYGSDVCGSTSCAPKYITNNSKRFPMKNSKDFDFSNPELLKREQKAISVLMNYIYDYDKNFRVSEVQVLNEPNYGDQYSSQGTAFINYIDRLGCTVKNSSYKVVTRVNFVISDKFLDTNYKLPEEILNLEGIDMVGPDVYVKDLEYIGKFAKRFSTGSMSNNVAHFAEGPGQMYNYPKQILYSFACNAGFKVYELKAYGNIDCDFGIFRSGVESWIKRDGTLKTSYQWDRSTRIDESVTDDIICLNHMINGISQQIATCPQDNFKMIFRKTSDIIKGQKITYITDEVRTANRIGAAFLASDGYYYLFTPAKIGKFTFEDSSISENASRGYFINGNWHEEKSIKIINGNTVDVEKGFIYRILSDKIK